MRLCPRCRHVRAPEEFHRSRSSPTGRMRHCMFCQRLAARRSYYRRRFERLEAAARRRAHRYGCRIEPVDYAALVAALPVRCSLCGQPLASVVEAEFHHRQALAQGGSHTPGNIQLVHRACNRRAAIRLFILSKTFNRVIRPS